MASEALVDPAPRARGKAAGNSYFFWMPVLLLASVLFGFAPTFFLGPLFSAPPLPLYLVFHGVVLTAWFSWLVLQSWLVRSRNTALHRKTGWVGAGIAAVMVVAAPIADFYAVERLQALGLTFESDMSAVPGLGLSNIEMLPFVSNVIWGNLAMITVFQLLFWAAIIYRKKPEVHKRLILMASFAIMAPAVARISRIEFLGGEQGPLIPLMVILLPLTMVAHDLFKDRRVHGATWVGIAVIAAAAIGQMQIAGSEFGLSVIRSLG